MATLLHDLLLSSARDNPDAVAMRAPGERVTYAELDAMVNRLARGLSRLGVEAGDRVGIWMPKSVRAVAAMQAALRLGAAYVPIDPMSPPMRAQRIILDCGIGTIVTCEDMGLLSLPEGACNAIGAEWGESLLSWTSVDGLPSGPVESPRVDPDDLAYILYTSGSTGTPKGVCLSHRNALAFIHWAVEALEPAASDRFSSHAPFHFDLSVLDLYVPFCVGASVFLVPDGMAYAPRRMVDIVKHEQLTVWYSVPSVLIMMMEHGGLLDAGDIALHTILFAGEPFPMKHLRRLRAHFASARLLNLYGPTETNVCTFFEVDACAPDDIAPAPIGSACCGDRVWAVKPDGSTAGAGEKGELWVAGPTVMKGYWGQEPQGDEPYRTGDIVEVLAQGVFRYVGRKDHMVKVRGYRIELGEIEAALLAHDAVHEAAVVVQGSGLAARLVAFVVGVPGVSVPSLLEFKRHLSTRLPPSMIIDAVRHVTELPRTPNGKIDRRSLGDMLKA